MFRKSFERQINTTLLPRSVANSARKLERCTNSILAQNYPNAFNPGTKIEYRFKELGLLKLSVFDLLGRELAVLVNERKDAARFANGLYFYALQAREFHETKKMILMK